VEAARADLEWTNNHRAVILAWLRNQQSDGGSENIASNTIVITIAFITALLRST
jgi:hypothetical protein